MRRTALAGVLSRFNDHRCRTLGLRRPMGNVNAPHRADPEKIHVGQALQEAFSQRIAPDGHHGVERVYGQEELGHRER